MKKNVVFFILLVFSNCIFAIATDLYPFQNQSQQTQFQQVTNELRCQVCQNQTIAESNAPLAVDLRTQAYQMVLAGKSNQDIIQYMVQRYGDFILYKPPLQANTYLLWFTPALLLLVGIIVLARVVIRK